MTVLQICHKPPFPPVDGGCIAMNNITQGLIQHGINIRILTLNTFKHPLNIDILPAGYRAQTHIETVFVDTRIKLTDAFLNYFSSASYNVSRFYSKLFEQKIIHVVKENKFDVIQLESLFTTPYLCAIRENSNAKVVLRAHNVEFEIWERAAEKEKNPLRKKYFQFLAQRMKNYEIGLLNKYDGIAVISEDDGMKLRQNGCKIPIANIPFGINFTEYCLPLNNSSASEVNLFYIGAMDWKPNCEGLEWFLDNVWKTTAEQFPLLKLKIAGRSMPGKFYALKSEQINVVGEVSDVKKYFQENEIMIAPLLNGSGVRVKIIEAMAMGKIIITTAVGAKGIHCEHKKNILIADSATDFSAMLAYAIENPEVRKNISENAIKFAKENYDNVTITKKLIDFYTHIIPLFQSPAHHLSADDRQANY